ncbi:HAD family hydrolase [Litorisediminicola beolgyonensis]|uniref:HAD family hydrolase n=1 Tax=Litorisediminicola beolgyonensis TaxID=1173614 RepID=A0ABW3ZF50_9RHOB
MALALLFDLDGTLLETDPLHVAVFRELFAERGREIDEAYYLERIHGRHNADIFADEFPGEDPQAMSDEKEARFRAKLGDSAPPMAGLPALLDRAEAAGWPIAVVTNAPRANAEASLGAIGLRHRFETLIIGDECARGKPDPEPYLAAMRALGVAPGECLAFEDSPSGLRAARASGAFTFGVTSSLSPAALRDAGAQEVIDDFTDDRLMRALAARAADQGADT